MNKNPIVVMELENGKTVTMELYPDQAPISAANFIALIRKGFYDGLTFHRVVPGFVVQGGDPTGTGMGGPGYSIKGEFLANGVPNKLSHTNGVLSWARSQRFDSAGSQFFICMGDQTFLDGQYAAFGKVTEGMDAVLAIRQGDKMKKLTVDTQGVDYPDPSL